MAEKVTVELVDDIDGSPAQEKVLFAVGGSMYEIDLSTKHAEAFHKALKPYVDAARAAVSQHPDHRRPGRPKGTTGKRASTYNAEDGKAARAYFQENQDKLPEGTKLPVRGRTPANIVEAWKALGSPGL